jgi:hypothetical protein
VHAQPASEEASTATTAASTTSTTTTATTTATTEPALAAHHKNIPEVLKARFRLHTDEHEPPPDVRVFTLTFWATVSIFAGLIPAGRLAMSLMLDTGPIWYPITAAGLGLLGLALVTGAFASIHRAYLPWYLMTIATLLLAGNIAMVYTVPWH